MVCMLSNNTVMGYGMNTVCVEIFGKNFKHPNFLSCAKDYIEDIAATFATMAKFFHNFFSLQYKGS